MIEGSSIRRHVIDLGTVVAVSVVVGVIILLQDASIAWRFGASDDVDAYQLALSFPAMALNVFAGGTLLAILVPRLVQLEVSGVPGEAAALIRRARRAVVVILIAVGIMWAAAYPVVIRMTAQFTPMTASTSERLLWILLVSLVFAGLSSVEAAVLNSRRRFWLLSALPGFAPAGAAIAVLAFGARIGIVAAPLGWLAGTVVQWIAATWRTRRLIGAAAHPAGAPDPQLLKDYLASAGAAALLGGIFLSDTWMAASLEPGSAAIFGYASRPLILIMAFATATVSNVALPAFSRLSAGGRMPALRRQFAMISAALVLAAIPVVLAFHAWAEPIVRLIYERGTFEAADTSRVAAVQAVYVLHAPLFVMAVLGWRVMNSLHRHAQLCTFTAVAFVTNLAVDLWLAADLGLVGVAWGTNAAFAAWAGLIGAYVIGFGRRSTRE